MNYQPSQSDHDSAISTAGCKETIELLPWWVHNALDVSDRQAVQVHLRGCSDCRRELEETLEAARIFEQHIPASALADYGHGLEPDSIDQESLEAHLRNCSSCRDELELMSTNIIPTPRRVVSPWKRALERPQYSAAAALLIVAFGLVLAREADLFSNFPDAKTAARQQELDTLRTVDLISSLDFERAEPQNFTWTALRQSSQSDEPFAASSIGPTKISGSGFETSDLSEWSVGNSQVTEDPNESKTQQI